MSFTVKICGLSEARSLDAALDAGADMVGFVFFARSPRHLTFDAARRLADRVEGRALKVALTVDADDPTLAAIIEALAPDILQLHGGESAARVATIRTRFGLPVMRAIAVAETSDLAQAAAFDSVADHLLFDARTPANASRPGGNGAPFDWTIARGIRTRRPWLLAGGLSAANVAEAIKATRAPGLDVSSGVESAPGQKEPTLISAFVTRARAAWEKLGSPQPIG